MFVKGTFHPCILALRDIAKAYPKDGMLSSCVMPSSHLKMTAFACF